MDGLANGPFGWGTEPDLAAIYFSGLSADTTELHLYELFASFGAIPRNGVSVMCSPDGVCKGYGIVTFVKEEAARQAVRWLDTTMQ